MAYNPYGRKLPSIDWPSNDGLRTLYSRLTVSSEPPFGRPPSFGAFPGAAGAPPGMGPPPNMGKLLACPKLNLKKLTANRWRPRHVCTWHRTSRNKPGQRRAERATERITCELPGPNNHAEHQLLRARYPPWNGPSQTVYTCWWRRWRKGWAE